MIGGAYIHSLFVSTPHPPSALPSYYPSIHPSIPQVHTEPLLHARHCARHQRCRDTRQPCPRRANVHRKQTRGAGNDKCRQHHRRTAAARPWWPPRPPVAQLLLPPSPSSHTGLPSGPRISQAQSHLHFWSLFQNVPPPRERHGSLPHFLLLTSARALSRRTESCHPTLHPEALLQSPPDARAAA